MQPRRYHGVPPRRGPLPVSPRRDLRSLAHRADFIIGVVLFIGIFWLLGDVLMLLFAAVLFAVALDALTALLRRVIPVPRLLAFAVSTASVFALIGLAAYHLVPQLLRQAGALWDQLTETLARVQSYLLEFDWIAEALRSAEEDLPLSDAAALAAGHITGAVAGAFSVASSLLIVAALGLFLCADPHLYRRGVVRLVPIRWTRRSVAVMSAIARGLRGWLMGQMFSMTFLGVAASAGLYLLGVELWLSLGLLVGLFTFVPYLGPVLAGVPVLAIAYGAGWETGVSVTIFYVLLQSLEGYLLTPLVQRQAVSIAPALLIGAQVVMGALMGVAGFLIAAPLSVAGMIAVKMLYVEDALGKSPSGGKRG